MWKLSEANSMEVLHTLIKGNTSTCSQIFKRIHSPFRHQNEGLLSKELNMQYHTYRQNLKLSQTVFLFSITSGKELGITKSLHCVPARKNCHIHLAPSYKIKTKQTILKTRPHILMTESKLNYK